MKILLKGLRALLFCISLKHKDDCDMSIISLRALLFCISLKLKQKDNECK